MRVLVDTPIWSLALRRSSRRLARSEAALVEEWAALIREGRVVLVGPVRQELLSGLRDDSAFERLRVRLRPFEDLPLETDDFETAAVAFNRCRRAGVTGSAVDLLLCAIAERRALPIFTADRDFERYARVLRFPLHAPRAHQG